MPKDWPQRSHLHGQSLEVACPTCKAEPFCSCTEGGKIIFDPHIARADAFLTLAKSR